MQLAGYVYNRKKWERPRFCQGFRNSTYASRQEKKSKACRGGKEIDMIARATGHKEGCYLHRNRRPIPSFAVPVKFIGGRDQALYEVVQHLQASGSLLRQKLPGYCCIAIVAFTERLAWRWLWLAAVLGLKDVSLSLLYANTGLRCGEGIIKS